MLVIVTQFIILFFIMLISLFLFLIVWKYYRNKQETKQQTVKRDLLSKLNRYIQQSEFPKEYNLEDSLVFHGVEEALAEYGSFVRDVETSRYIREYVEKNFTPYYRRLLSHRSWSIRMNTLYRIDDFQMTTLHKELMKLYRSSETTKLEKYQIMRIFATLQHENLFYMLGGQGEGLPNFYYRDILLRLDEAFFAKFIERSKEYSLPLLEGLLDAVGEKRDITYLSFVEQMLLHSSIEIRIRALKAISKLGYIQRYDIVFQLAQSNSWQERLMCARILAKVQTKDSLSFLKTMMSDSSWWVRSAAAQSVLEFADGRKILSEISNHHEDQYARDMAKEWLERRELVHDS
ncbi:HEAT repeat domain-containing protein [Bacillus taeanensis]|uniref:HEAT repeat domain-containing protein n=1 Tax=Bacillus taeanensis TaxID=273032 RepID=A0A366Y3C7_9BACI|nr:HEAT repeat domain-containing protein [Bacillus taeanensis]RBW71509.1 hypothetical protein DS031_01810 [Bacillus taeanensis]